MFGVKQSTRMADLEREFKNKVRDAVARNVPTNKMSEEFDIVRAYIMLKEEDEVLVRYDALSEMLDSYENVHYKEIQDKIWDTQQDVSKIQGIVEQQKARREEMIEKKAQLTPTKNKEALAQIKEELEELQAIMDSTKQSLVTAKQVHARMEKREKNLSEMNVKVQRELQDEKSRLIRWPAKQELFTKIITVSDDIHRDAMPPPPPLSRPEKRVRVAVEPSSNE